MSTFDPDRFDIKDLTFKPYIDQEKIEQRVSEIGHKLSRRFNDDTPILIGILNGAFMFLSDLIRTLDIPCEIDFWKLSSYGDEKVSSGQIDELKSLDADIENRQVILVEDIVDSGLSMNYMLEQLDAYNPSGVTTVTLLHKKQATRYDVQLDYVGFEIPDHFVVGYGLDYAQQGRNLPHIYIRDEK
jgi:hypoxanthine phosphoribosyltransferase